MDAQTINFMTWNVNGLKQNRDQKFQKIQNADIVFLQETHIGVGDELIVENYKDKWTVFYTKYNSSSKGTAILVSKRLDFEYISDEKDNHGAYVVLKYKLAGQPYTLVSVYNHQTDTETLDNLSRYLQSMTTGLLVIGGDFNTVVNPFIDKKCNTNKTIKSRNHRKLYLFVQKFMKSLQLVDVWRKMNPVKQDFTFYIKDCPVSRLDYFFVPEECVWRVRSCEIRNSEISESKDHQPVYLNINNVSTVPKCQKPLHTQPHLQLLIHKKDHLTDEMGSLLDAENSNAVSAVDIISAIQSLQVSDTPRPDGIPVSFYKDNIQDLIPYIKTVYDRIHRGAFNCSQNHFNETVKSLYDERQHFFNVDYLIIATILGRQLDDIIQSHSKGHVPKDSAMIMITPKSLCTLISLSFIKNEIEKQKLSSTTLSLNFLSMENLLSDPKEVADYKSFPDEKCKLLHQGCPLTPGLITLALKSYASQLFGHLNMHEIFIFKENIIGCFKPEDEENVKSFVESSANEIHNIEILTRENNKDWDEWVTEAFWNEEEMEKKSKNANVDERDHGSETYKETEGRSAIFSEISGNEMESSHRRTSNPPPLLPVPSQSGTSYGGTKRKRDHEHFSIDLTQTTEEIISETKEIMRRSNEKVQAMRNADETKATLNKYIGEALSKMNKNNSKKIIIGILGESGQGKTSLLNAVLKKKNLLPSGCFGACTAVVTQIEANLTDSNYIAEIELLTKQEWEEHLKNLVTALKTESNESKHNITEDAREKINALYGADAENRSFEELKNYEFDEMTNHLSSSNASNFAEQLRRYIQYNVAGAGGWYWPLVKSVTIKIPDCHDLLENIVLIDLPGTGDCNEIRDNKWKSKLRECSSVWILSDIIRAVTNKDTWDMLKYCNTDMMEAGECRDIHFICTKSDNIDPDEFNSTLEEKLPEDEELTKKCILQRNKQAKDIVLKTFENSKIQKKMNLKVFTVSSRGFFDCKLGLEHDDTEIPKLQDVLRTMNMRINEDLARHCVTEAKAVMSLISEKTAKAEVHTILERNLEKALDKLDIQFDMLRCLLSNGLSNGVEKSKSSCCASARQTISPELPKGHGGFHKILQALCKNGGRYRSKAWDTVLDLNECLAKPICENIEAEFNLIFTVTANTGISVQELIDKFSIINNFDSTKFPLINHSMDFIKAQEEKQKQSLKELVVKRKKRIYTSIQETIKSKMASGYAEAARYTGVGCLKRKQVKLLDDIDTLRHNMFDGAKEEVLRQSDELMGEIKETLKSELNTSIQLFAQTKTLLDVSQETRELDRLSAQLYH